MTKYLYSLRNRLGGFVENPICEIIEPDKYFEYLSQSLVYAEIPLLERYKECELAYLGTLDNKSGAIVPCFEILGDLEQVCLSIVSAKSLKKEEVSNGKEA